MKRRAFSAARATALSAALLFTCMAAEEGAFARDRAPATPALRASMRAKDMQPSAPVLIRVFKKEAELEVWKQRADGRYALLKTFPVCRWSGQLGPKRRTGDRQTPEGFYVIRPEQMNPRSAYHLSFNIGFPNAHDRAHGYTGSYLMVHGACSSMGCYAMTDAGVQEIYGLLRDAFRGGQKQVQFQAYPFRMTSRNMALARDDPNYAFWSQLKTGYDRFEATGTPPVVQMTGKRYLFAPYTDRSAEAKATEKLEAERTAIQREIDGGAPAVRITYADGGMHPSFASLRSRTALGVISRPEALAQAGRVVVVRAGKTQGAPALAAGTPSFTFFAWEARLRRPPPAPALPAGLSPPPSSLPSPAARIAMAHAGAIYTEGKQPPAHAAAQPRDAWTGALVALASVREPSR